VRPSSFAFSFGRGIATVSEEEEEEEEEEESRCRSPKSSNVSHADKDFEVDADGEGNATHDSIDAACASFFFYRWCLSSRRRRAFVTFMMIATSFKEAVRCRVASKKRLWHILFLFYSKKGQKINKKCSMGKKEQKVENWIAFPHKKEEEERLAHRRSS